MTSNFTDDTKVSESIEIDTKPPEDGCRAHVCAPSCIIYLGIAYVLA